MPNLWAYKANRASLSTHGMSLNLNTLPKNNFSGHVNRHVTCDSFKKALMPPERPMWPFEWDMALYGAIWVALQNTMKSLQKVI